MPMDNESPSPSFQEAIQRIRNDTSSGAAEIAHQVLKAIQAEGIASANLSKSKHWQHLLNCSKFLLETHPEMAALASVLQEFLGRVRTDFQERENSLDRTNAIQTISANLLHDLRFREEQTARNLASCLERYRTIITLSWSSTVFKGFEKLVHEVGAETKRIIVAESRPLLEGRTLAAKLARLGYEVNLIADAAIGRYCHEANAAICGADTVLADGSILNKVGTYLLALSCADCDESIPFIVAATTTKFSYRSLRADYTPAIKERPREEILENWRAMGIIPCNEYFEIVPARLISMLISEEGCISSEIGQTVKQILQRRFSPSLEWDFEDILRS